jgi:hypothetical protein
MSLDIAVIAGYMVAISIIGIAYARVTSVNEEYSVIWPWFVPIDSLFPSPRVPR